LGFQIVKEKLAGSIKPISIGKGKKAVSVGGASCYPFYLFEGSMTNKPKIAMEVWDMEPTGWPEVAKSHFKDVLADPAAWAKKCVDKFGADMIVLQLKSADPNDKNAGADDIVKTVKKSIKGDQRSAYRLGMRQRSKGRGGFQENLRSLPGREPDHRTCGREKPQRCGRVRHGIWPHHHFLISH
jgi:hypothetical protein